MSAKLYQQLLTALKAHGFVYKRPAAGSHEIWWNPHPKHKLLCHAALLHAIQSTQF
jgi:hypothetical protein